MTFQELLKLMVSKGASDVHLQVGSPPMARIDGLLNRFGDSALVPSDTEAIAKGILGPERWEKFSYSTEMDFAYSLPGVARFRCNLFRQRGSIGLAMRAISDTIPSFESLGLPVKSMVEFVQKDRGLILVTGPTGSGKSSTLASMIDYLNRNYPYVIITIEDPIEVLHKNQKSVVAQREIGEDTKDFKGALKYAMRQDPDVIMIGEIRDKETVETALSAAQTGHLVLSTLHTLDSIRTVNRIIDFFAPYERDQIRIMLAESLIGIISQRLLPRADGLGRVLALELMINTPFIQDCIRDEDKVAEIKDNMLQDNYRGMQTFDQHLALLVQSGLISIEEAKSAATSSHELTLMLTRQGVGSAISGNSN
jgi:twitching motility protein PilT